MLASVAEFKFFQSFRIPVEDIDEIRFLLESKGPTGDYNFVADARLIDVSINGLGFKSKSKINVGSEVRISLQYGKVHLDLEGKIVRVISKAIDDEEMIYGVEIDESIELEKFIKKLVDSFPQERLKESLKDLTLKEKGFNITEGLELFSLLMSVFKDITNNAHKEEFIEGLLMEVTRIVNAQRASIFLFNPDSHELEALEALGMDKKLLKFDYRKGIAGSVFTTGVALNISTQDENVPFMKKFDKMTGFKTSSIICYPIKNKFDKIIGVIEVLNKKNEDRFSSDDERTMKILSLIFSSVFHSYDPTPKKEQKHYRSFLEGNALKGSSKIMQDLRNSIDKIKDLETNVLIVGEVGVGKKLVAEILHHEGSRGLENFSCIECSTLSTQQLGKLIFGDLKNKGQLLKNQGGTILLRDVHLLSHKIQEKLLKVLSNKVLLQEATTLDVRILSTTSEDLVELVHTGKFSKELYELLSQSKLFIHPLRSHAEDVVDLIEHFVKIECRNHGWLYKKVSPKVLEFLSYYDWPGNIEELRDFTVQIVQLNPKSHVIDQVNSFSFSPLYLNKSNKRWLYMDFPYLSDNSLSLKDKVALVEREMIVNEINLCRGNKSKAARNLSISREALRKKMMQSGEVLENLKKLNGNNGLASATTTDTSSELSDSDTHQEIDKKSDEPDVA